MKKILFFVMAAFAMLVTSCQSCGSEQEQKKDEAVIIKTDNWEAIIAKIWPVVNAQYPEYAFYEASGSLKKLDSGNWGVDRNTFRAAYGCPFKNASVLAYVENDTLKLMQVDEPWLEDVYMTPFVPCGLDLAIKTLQKVVDLEPEGLPAVLRFQLFPGIVEPEWIVGSISGCHSVNVYSMKVDVPLKGVEGLVVEHTGLAAKKALK